MAEKIFNTRVVNKHDLEANWNKAVNFIPLKGELIVYDVDEAHSYERVKIGDGVQNVNDLPFYNDGFVSYNEQTLTDEQKAQARANIGTADQTSLDEVSALVGDTAVSEQIDNAIAEIPQADWNQNDPTAPDFVKNRPFYEETVETDISGTTYTLGRVSSANTEYTHDELPLQLGQEWTLSYSAMSETYTTSVLEAKDGTLYIGDLSCNAIPFYATATTHLGGSVVNIMGSGTLSATCVSGTVSETTVHKLDAKYLPDETQPDWNQNDPDGDGYIANRTHYEEDITQVIDCEIDVAPANTITYQVYTYDELPLVVGQELTLWFKGSSSTEYNNSFGTTIVEKDENGDLVAYIPSVDNQRFIIRPTEISATGSDMYNANADYLKITGESIVNKVHQLDPKYIPDTIARTSDVEAVSVLVGDTSVSEQISVAVAEKITAPTTASVGQLLAVKAVDENGKPTEWEVVDMPESVTDDYIKELIDASGAVKSVNGIAPDGNGNVEIETGGVYVGSGDMPDGYNIQIDPTDEANVVVTVNGIAPDENGNVEIAVSDSEVEIPTTLPNPNALTFTGAVSATYDGSKAVSVEIPSGGNENLQLLFDVTTTEEVRSIRSGVNPANYKEIFMVCTAMPDDTTKTTHFDWIFGSVPFRITNSLHNTQERVHVFHAKKLSDESGIWEIGLGLGLRSKGGGTVKTIDEMGFTAIDVKEKYGKVYVFNNDLAADIGCEAYLYGETNLAIGAELRVYGR